MFYLGIVESRLDPLKLGRCKVRIIGLHTEDKTILPTDELPWAHPVMPINSASMSGLGWSPTGVVQGSCVLCVFLDDANQQPVMLGTIGGIPHTQSAAFVNDATNGIVTTDESGELVSSDGANVTDIIDSILSESNSKTDVQQSGSKYHVISVNTQLITGNTITYKVVDDYNNAIAESTYDSVNQLYSMTLLNPEKYTQEQYLPFLDKTPLTFKTTDEMVLYFDKNF